MGTRIYLSLPSPPELAKYHALIVPIHHRVNTLECDDDEWDEIRVRVFPYFEKNDLLYINRIL